VCLDCRLTLRAAKAPHSRCPRCHAHLHERKPHSLALTTALLIAAAVLYVPANILPVMDTRTFFDDENDTIMSGVLVLLHSGMEGDLSYDTSARTAEQRYLALSRELSRTLETRHGARSNRSDLRAVESAGQSWSCDSRTPR
jgi:hypothetical protein